VWTVTDEVPDVLYYQCEKHTSQWGALTFAINASIPVTRSDTGQGFVIAHLVLMTVSYAVLIPLGVLTSSFMPFKVRFNCIFPLFFKKK
jgi:hypothetical protein